MYQFVNEHTPVSGKYTHAIFLSALEVLQSWFTVHLKVITTTIVILSTHAPAKLSEFRILCYCRCAE